MGIKLYNLGDRKFRSWREDAGMRTMFQQRLGLQASGWAAQENGKERLWKPEEFGGQYVAVFVRSPTHLSHTTLSIKWEVYFSKELCPLVFIALCFCMHRHMSIQRHILPVQILYSVLHHDICHTIVDCILLDILLLNNSYLINWHYCSSRERTNLSCSKHSSPEITIERHLFFGGGCKKYHKP